MAVTLRPVLPAWPWGDLVKAFTTTRSGGISTPPYDTFNLAEHVGDDPEHVAGNRLLLDGMVGQRRLQWLNQVHGTRVVEAGDGVAVPEADAVWTAERGLVLAVLTADCLPVLIVNEDGSALGLAHGGWRGLVNGILEATLSAMPGGRRVAWLGPAIGPEDYEVGDEVLDAVAALGAFAASAILPGTAPGKGYLDLYTLAELELARLGVERVYCERYSTLGCLDFYSYRRDGTTGRMATVAWLP